MAEQDEDDVKYTIFVLGPGAVGKTALTIRFLSDSFIDDYEPTIEDFYRKTIDVAKIGKVSLEIYDTAGQEEFSTMKDEYYRTGDGFLLVYNIASSLSFNEVQTSYSKLVNARRINDPNAGAPPLVLAGNKCDLAAEGRQVDTNMAKNLAKTWNCPFYECSAKTKVNNVIIFEDLVREIVARENGGLMKKASKEPAPQNGGGCCLIL